MLVAGVLAAVFAAGLASGTAIRGLLARGTEGPSTSWDAMVRAMDLTAEQERRIDSIFDTYQPRTDTLLMSLVPRLRALADSMDTDLRPVLTESQRELLSDARSRQLFMLRLKTPQGERVDTLRLQPGGR